MSSLDYRGQESTTYQLVLLGFLTATGLVIAGIITGSEWVTGALGLLTAYVLKQVGTSVAEAYRDKPVTTIMNTDSSSPTVTTTTTTGQPKDNGL